MTLSFRVRGYLYKKDDIQNISEGFKKRVFVLEIYDNPIYKDYLMFDLIQEKCSFIDGFNLGDSLLVDFNIKGREYKKEGDKPKYFITLQAWRITKDESDKTYSTGPNVENKSQEGAGNIEGGSSNNEEDDLPF